MFLLLFGSFFGTASFGRDLTALYRHAWRVTGTVTNSPTGEIYVFLPNGTLLETSCVETYRIATWRIDKNNPGTIRVAEDGRLAFTAVIAALSSTKLEFRQTLVRSGEKHSLTFKAVEGEFVCPDLQR